MAHENDNSSMEHNEKAVKACAQSTSMCEAKGKEHAMKPTRQIQGSVPGGKKMG